MYRSKSVSYIGYEFSWYNFSRIIFPSNDGNKEMAIQGA